MARKKNARKKNEEQVEKESIPLNERQIGKCQVWAPRDGNGKRIIVVNAPKGEDVEYYVLAGDESDVISRDEFRELFTRIDGR